MATEKQKKLAKEMIAFHLLEIRELQRRLKGVQPRNVIYPARNDKGSLDIFIARRKCSVLLYRAFLKGDVKYWPMDKEHGFTREARLFLKAGESSRLPNKV